MPISPLQTLLRTNERPVFSNELISARVPGTEDYCSLLTRLSKQPNDETPSCNRLCRLQRNLNKYLGRPATPDVGTIAVLLKDLKWATEQVLGEPIDPDTQYVAVSVPPITAFADYDIDDAMEYAGLRSWKTEAFPYPYKLESAPMAYAGSGQGLCEDYLDLYTCWDEIWEMPVHYVFAVTFTFSALSWQLTLLQDPFDDYLSEHRFNMKDINFSLGEPWNLANATHWSAVEEYLYQGAMQSRSVDYPISKILLIGESAWRPELRAALKNALARANDGGGLPPPEPEPTSLPPGKQQVIGTKNRNQPGWSSLFHDWESIEKAVDQAAMADPQVLASRGAAVFARRRQETPKACMEPRGCRNDEAAESYLWPGGGRMGLA
ncbi:MAG: hypothetical protein Q9160_006633 [Pyrenula sp. 1 TL-2023]